MPDAEERDKVVGIVDVGLRAVGHQDADDVLLAVCRAAQRRDDGAVLAAGHADDGGLAAARAHLRAHPVEQPGELGAGVEFVHRTASLKIVLDSGRGLGIIISKRG